MRKGFKGFMNKVFKVVWSKSKECYVVVPEIAKNNSGKKKVLASVLAGLAVAGAMGGIAPQQAMAGYDTGNSHVNIWADTNPKSNGQNYNVGQNSIVVGYQNTTDNVAGHDGKVAIGAKNTSTNNASTAVGNENKATGGAATAVGAGNTASGKASVALGNVNNADAKAAIAIGTYNNVNYTKGSWQTTPKHAGEYSTVVGNYSSATGTSASAMGVYTNATGAGSFAAGYNNNANGQNSVAIGSENTSHVADTVTLGQFNNAKTMGGISIGKNNLTDSSNNGQNAANTRDENSQIAIGRDNVATHLDTIAIGRETTASGSGSTVVGARAEASGDNSIAIGQSGKGSPKVIASGVNSIAIGMQSQATGEAAIAEGAGSRAGGKYGVALGRTTKANAEAATALGNAAEANIANGVALGASSVTTTDKGVLGYNPSDPHDRKYKNLKGNVQTATTAAVSIGNGETLTRQLTGLAAGTADTDAVNVAQLKNVGVAVAGNTGKSDFLADGGRLNVIGTGRVSTVAAHEGEKDSTITVAFDDKGMVKAGKNVKVDEVTVNGRTTYTINAADAAAKYDFLTNAKANGGKLDGTATPTKVESGQTVTYAAGKNLTVKQDIDQSAGEQTYTYSLNKDLKEITSITNNGGPTMHFGGDNISITGGNLDLGDHNITNLKSGGDVINNAANIGDVIRISKANDLHIAPTAGTNNNVAEYTVDANKKVTLTYQDGNGNTVTGPKAVIDLSGLKTGDMSSFNVKSSATEGKVAQGSAGVQEIRDGKTVEMQAGKNMTIKQTNNNGNAAVEFSLNKNVDLTPDGSLKIGDTNITDNGLTINNGPSITKTGINAGDLNITNVKAGVNDNDAVNVSQLKKVRADERHIKPGEYAVDNNGKVTMTYLDGNNKDVPNETAVITGIAKQDLSNINNDGKKEITKLGTIVKAGDNVTVSEASDATTGQKTYTVNAVTPAVYTKADGTKVVKRPNGTYTTNLDGSAGNDVPASDVIVSFQDAAGNTTGGSSIVNNVGSAIDKTGTSTGDTFLTNLNTAATDNPFAAVNVRDLKSTADALKASELHIAPTAVKAGSTEATGGVANGAENVYKYDAATKKVTLTYNDGKGNAVTDTKAVIDFTDLNTGGTTASSWNVKSSANTTDGGAVADTHDANAQNIADTKTVEFQSGKNLVVKQTNDTTNGNATVEFSLSDNITAGKDGANGKDGSVGATGKDGASVVLNGKDGSIGMTGPKGQDGKDGINGRDGANISITSAKGEQVLTNRDPAHNSDTDKAERIVYVPKDANGNPIQGADGKNIVREVATMDDGLKFTGNNESTVNKQQLGSLVKVQGEGTKEGTDTAGAKEIQTSDGTKFESAKDNIAVEADGANTLTVKLNKDLKGLNSVTTEKVITKEIDLSDPHGTTTATIKYDDNRITYTNDGGQHEYKVANLNDEKHITQGVYTVGDKSIDSKAANDEVTLTYTSGYDELIRDKDGNPITTKIKGIAKSDLSNITDAGKNVITGLGTVVKAGDNVTVSEASDATTGQKTYTVNAVTPAVYTKADGTKVVKRPDGTFTTNIDGAPGNDVPASDVIVSFQDAAGNRTGGSSIVNNVGSAIDKTGTSTGDTFLTNLNDAATATPFAAVNVRDLKSTADALKASELHIAPTAVKAGSTEATGGVASGAENVYKYDAATKKVTLTYNDGNGKAVTDTKAVIDFSDLNVPAGGNNYGFKANATANGGTVEGTATETAVENGGTVNFAAGKNLTVKQDLDATNKTHTYTFSLDKDLTNLDKVVVNGKDGIAGKDGVTIVGPQGATGATGIPGTNGIDGKVGITGKDGKDAVSIAGKDGVGTIGLTGPQGPAGTNGKSVDISTENGTKTLFKPEANNNDQSQRIVYVPKDANGNPLKDADNNDIKREVATMDDGLRFTGNNTSTENKQKLGSLVKVEGEGVTEAQANSFQSAAGNIAVVANGADTLTVKLNKDLKGLDSVTTKEVKLGDANDNISIKKDGDRITYSTDGGTTVNKVANLADEQHIKDTTYTVGTDKKVKLTYVDGNGKDVTGKTAIIDLSNLPVGDKDTDMRIKEGDYTAKNGSVTLNTVDKDGNPVAGKDVVIKGINTNNYQAGDNVTFTNDGNDADGNPIVKINADVSTEKVEAKAVAGNLAKVTGKTGTAKGETYEVAVTKGDIENNAEISYKASTSNDVGSQTAKKTTLANGFDFTSDDHSVAITTGANGKVNFKVDTTGIQGKAFNLDVEKEGTGKVENAQTAATTPSVEKGTKFVAGNNLSIRHDAINGDNNYDHKVTYALNSDLKGITSITNNGGATMNFGPNEISMTGGNLNMGGNKITNVKNGTDKSDVATVGQLTKVTSNDNSVSINKSTDADGAPVYDLSVQGGRDPRVDELGEEIGRVGAQGAALAALKPIQYDPLEPTQIMAGYGNYRGNSAIAMGVAHYKNESTLMHAGLSWAGGSRHMMANAGVTWKVGNRDSEAAVADRYRKGPISSAYAMQQEMASVKAQNAGLKTEVSDLKAENEQMKAQIAAMMAKLGM